MIRPPQLAIVLTLICAAGAAIGATRPAGDGNDLQSAVADLAAEDPVLRRDAQQQLRAAGRAARPALLHAAASPDPAVAHAARELLLSIPWYEPSDPPAVRRLLEGYGTQNDMGRRQVIAELASEVGPDAAPALLRLLTEDPSDAVRWQVVHAIQADRTLIDPEQLAALDDPDVDSAPVLAARAAALAHQTRDDPQAVLPLYRRILALEARNPTPDHGAIQPIVDHLIGYNLVNRHFDEAADLLRIVIFRNLTLNPDELTHPVLRLFALHAAFGPLRGFADDVRDHLPHLDPSLQLHAMAEVNDRSGNGLAAIPMRALADSLMRSSEDSRPLADWLSVVGWQDAAEWQYRRLLAENPPRIRQIDIHVRLAHLRGQAGDDAAAAAHLQTILRLLDEFEGIMVRGDNRNAMDWLREQTQWRQLRDARTRDDPQAVEKHAESLLRAQTTDADILADLVPILRDRNRAAEADRLAEQAYQQLKSILDADPEDPHTLNNMAWLLARTNQRLDEALKFANWAVTHSPYNSAFIDTLAEVHYMRGDPEKSVELERKALLLNPGDRFMTDQLKKYQAAAGVE